MQMFTRTMHYKTFEFLCFITGIKVTSEHLEARNAVVTFLMFVKLHLQLRCLISNSSEFNIDEITSFMICGLAYRCEICLILFFPEILGWEMTRVGKSGHKKQQQKRTSSLLLYIQYVFCIGILDTAHRSTCIM